MSESAVVRERLRHEVRHLARIWRTALLGAYILLVPSESYLAYLEHDEQRVLQVLLLFVLAGSLMVRRDRLAALLLGLGRWRYALLAMIAIGVLSSMLAVDPFTGLLDVGLLLGLVGAGLAVATDVAVDPRRTVWLLTVAMITSLAYYAADLLTFPGATADSSVLWSRGSAGGFANPRHMAQYLTVLLPACAAVAAMRELPPWVRAVVFTVGVSVWWMVLVTTGRGAVIALLVAGGLVALRSPTGRRVAAGAGLAGVGGAVMAYVTHWRETSLLTELGGVEGALSSSGRMAIWRDALEVVVANPVVGVGPGHLAHVQRLDLADYTINHPHNIVLQFAAEWGLAVGVLVAVTAAWVVVALVFVRVELPRASAVPQELVAGIIMAMLAALALALLSGVFVMPVASTAAAAVIGVVLGLRTPAETQATGRVAATVAVLLVAVGVMAPTYEVASTTPAEQVDLTRAYLAGTGNTIVGPRFWRQGLRGGDWPVPPPPEVVEVG